MSLEDRSKAFKKAFPGSHMNYTLLKQVYAKHKIKKRAVRYEKRLKNMGPDQLQAALNKMKNQLTKVRHQDYRIIYLDETHFTRKTLPATEWCL